MKLNNRIPLNSTVETQDSVTGEIKAVAVSRSVKDEIKRLRDSGMEIAAQRLENSCEDFIPEAQQPIDTRKLLGLTAEKVEAVPA